MRFLAPCALGWFRYQQFCTHGFKRAEGRAIGRDGSFVAPGALLVLLLALPGCVDSGSNQLLTAKALPAATATIAGQHEIYVATTRKRSAEPLEGFSGARSPQTAFASVRVSVPKVHRTGGIERRKGRVADASRYFTATNLSVYNEAGFAKTLKADIASNHGRALVFVHGYRTGFDAAVYRVTQIVHDAGYKGTPVLFSWASGGRTVDYVYDNNSATAARDALEQTIRLVAAAGATRIDIVAHSMGNWATMEALRQLAIANDRTLGGKIGDVILASPDLDVDVFKAQMARYGKPEKPFVIMLSKDDKALRISGLLAGDKPRVGDYENAAELAELGVVVVDLSQLKGDSLGHTKFAENPVMIEMLGAGLNNPFDNPENEAQLTDRVGELTGNIGRTLGSAAEIIITTPLDVVRIAVGG